MLLMEEHLKGGFSMRLFILFWLHHVNGQVINLVLSRFVDAQCAALRVTWLHVFVAGAGTMMSRIPLAKHLTWQGALNFFNGQCTPTGDGKYMSFNKPVDSHPDCSAQGAVDVGEGADVAYEERYYMQFYNDNGCQNPNQMAEISLRMQRTQGTFQYNKYQWRVYRGSQHCLDYVDASERAANFTAAVINSDINNFKLMCGNMDGLGNGVLVRQHQGSVCSGISQDAVYWRDLNHGSTAEAFYGKSVSFRQTSSRRMLGRTPMTQAQTIPSNAEAVCPRMLLLALVTLAVWSRSCTSGKGKSKAQCKDHEMRCRRCLATLIVQKGCDRSNFARVISARFAEKAEHQLLDFYNEMKDVREATRTQVRKIPFTAATRACRAARKARKLYVELTEEEQEEQTLLLEDAVDLSEAGDLPGALKKLTAAICKGRASCLMYCRRAEVLLRLKRPHASVHDCAAGLALKSDSAKAFKIRARAHAQLENWKEAHADFRESLNIDFDEAIEEEAKMVESKLAKKALQRWEVVGGAEKGGVVVRQGVELKSSEASCRLSTGAIVEEPTDRRAAQPILSRSLWFSFGSRKHISQKFLNEPRKCIALCAPKQSNRIQRNPTESSFLSSFLSLFRRLQDFPLHQELQLVGERLRYRRLSGTGPDEGLTDSLATFQDASRCFKLKRRSPSEDLTEAVEAIVDGSGWISISLKDKVLACRLSSSETVDSVDVEANQDEPPFPEMAPEHVQELDDQALDKQQELKAASAELADEQDFEKAMNKLTEAIAIGCATALMYGRRAELLMRLNRPRAALRDCGRALELNPDSGKAYKTRARANAKLKHWAAAHADFQEGLKIDYDDATYEESLSVAAKMKEITAVATARRVKEEADKERKQAKKLHDASNNAYHLPRTLECKCMSGNGLVHFSLFTSYSFF
eukprot:s1998_g9.t1